ncbi:MAG: hypothetical protein WB511_02025 [Nitrososphaeraceae archaeon]
MRNLLLDKITNLQNICKEISKLKSQLIPEQPHYAHDALFFRNDEITTLLLNNTTEFKIHLVTGQFLYHYGEEGIFIDLVNENVREKLKGVASRHNLKLSKPVNNFENLNLNNLSDYLKFASKANRSLELFRMKLRGNFTQVHLWPHGFDFSVEWFPNNDTEQVGVGISPGESEYLLPYLYVNPYPFKKNLAYDLLPFGVWHIRDNWKGIKVEWEDLENKSELEIADNIYELFLIAFANFN